MNTNETTQLLILSGLPGSGKTKIANEWVNEDPGNRVRVNFDDLRLELYGPDWIFNYPEEHAMKARARLHAELALKNGTSVVVDNTHLTPNSRQVWIDLGKSLGVEVIQQEVDTPVHVCVERDRFRIGNSRVGRAVIENMALFNGFITFDDEE